MRASTKRLSLLLAALFLFTGAITASPSVSFAQSEFDDEFDDEFGDAETTEPAAEVADEFEEVVSGDSEFDDSFDAAEDLEDASDEMADEFDANVDADNDEPEDLRLQQLRTHNTYYGATGGLHIVDAAGGAVGSFRVQLATDFFFSNGFIVEEDSASHVGGSLSISWTPHSNIELFASLQSYANSNLAGDPSLFQVLGDTMVGVKGFFNVGDLLTVGGDLSIALLNRVGDIGVIFSGTSFGIRANATLDLRGLDNPFPLVARLNLQYFVDNSANLIEDVEQERYDNLPDAASDMGNEFRHLLTNVERFALNINRTDFFNIGLGFEMPLRVSESFGIHPLLEWQWKIPVNRQGYSCLFIPGEDGGDEPAAGSDGCLDRQGLGSFPMDLTLGVRVLPPLEGLSVLLAADIGLTGSRGTFVRELAPNAPYNIYVGLSYAYDTREPEIPEPEIREVEREVEVQIPPPLMGRVRGEVREQGAGTSIANATIRFPGRDVTALLTNESGVFTTYRFEPGEVQFEITHPEYNPGQCVATIPDERPEEGELEVQVVCELVALPRVGAIAGTIVSGDGGSGVAGAQVTISGPASHNVTTGPDGSFTVQDLAPGTYNVRVDAENFLIKTDSVDVEPRESASPTITLVPRPRRSLVRVRRSQIQIRRKINFATDSAEILPSSEGLMAEIADVMIRNPNITRIEIQGHTDNRGSAEHNLDLSQRRADSVRTWLINHGVDAARLTSRGYGQGEPLVPNITPANRARNRRVQFMIQEQTDAE